MSTNPDQTAVMGQRIAATVIDGLIAFVPAAAVSATTFTSLDAAQREQVGTVQDPDQFCTTYMDRHDGFCFNSNGTVYYSDNGVLVFVAILYAVRLLHVVLQSITGATIGKHLTGIRVVGADGRKAGFGRILVRWMMWIVDSLPAFGLVGFITGLTSTGHRRVGDMVAKTYVVHKSSVGHPIQAPGFHADGSTWPAGAAGGTPTARPGPQWDEARGTYIQWDPEAQDWMQWDEAAKRWDPIPSTPTIPPPPTAAPPPPPPTAPPPAAPPPPPSPPT